MTALSRLSLLVLALSASGSLLGACQSLAGITDRSYLAPGAGGGGDGEGATAGQLGETAGQAGEGGVPGDSPECVDYCTRIGKLCRKPNVQYTDVTTCLGICKLFPPGKNIEMTGNTLVCRINQIAIQESPSAEPSTLPDACTSSGPGGNGACGSNCESYCSQYQAACQQYEPNLTDTQYDQTKCVASCLGLTDTGHFDTDSDTGGDTLQCRLYHTSAATVDPTTHCPHAQLQALPAGTGPCTYAPGALPDCPSFCQLEMAECQGSYQMYADMPQCLAVCNALTLGTIGDTSQNTVGCRKYHSYNAMVAPDVHCSHTAPGGDGHCGDPATGNCESYCGLAAKACAAGTPGVDPLNTFETTYLNQAGCMKACDKIPGEVNDSGYSLKAKGNNVQCLLLHASKALSTPADDCAAALGAAPCK